MILFIVNNRGWKTFVPPLVMPFLAFCAVLMLMMAVDNTVAQQLQLKDTDGNPLFWPPPGNVPMMGDPRYTSNWTDNTPKLKLLGRDGQTPLKSLGNRNLVLVLQKLDGSSRFPELKGEVGKPLLGLMSADSKQEPVKEDGKYVLVQVSADETHVERLPPPMRHKTFKKDMESKTATEYSCTGKKDGKEEFCGCVIKNATGHWTTTPANFQFPSSDLKCSADFYKLAIMPVCGNEWFDQMKLCALTNFFEDKQPPAGAKEDENQKLLIMLDGCFTSSSATAEAPCQVTGLKVTHLEPGGGGLFSSCSEVKQWCGLADEEKCAEDSGYERTGLAIDVVKTAATSGDEKEGSTTSTDSAPAKVPITVQTASFTLPAVLRHRVCDKVLFGNWRPDDKYNSLKLHVTHNCGGNGKITVVKLPDIIVGEFGNRYAELRGLHVNLDESANVEQFVRKGTDNAADAVKFDRKEITDESRLVWDEEAKKLDGWTKVNKEEGSTPVLTPTEQP